MGTWFLRKTLITRIKKVYIDVQSYFIYLCVLKVVKNMVKIKESRTY